MRLQLRFGGIQLQQAVLVVLQSTLQIAHFFGKRSIDRFQLGALGVQHLQYCILGFNGGNLRVEVGNATETLYLRHKFAFALGNLAFLDGDFALQLFHLRRHFVDFYIHTHRFQQFAHRLDGHAESVQTFFDFRNGLFHCVKFVLAHHLFAFKTLLRFV